MYPSDIKHNFIQATGTVLEYESDWTILGVSIRTFGTTVDSACADSFYLVANDSGSVLASLEGHALLGDDTMGAAITTQGEQVMSFPLAYVTQSADVLDLVVVDEDYCHSNVQAEVYYVEYPYASSSPMQTTIDAIGIIAGAFAFLAMLGIIMFYFKRK